MVADCGRLWRVASLSTLRVQSMSPGPSYRALSLVRSRRRGIMLPTQSRVSFRPYAQYHLSIRKIQEHPGNVLSGPFESLYHVHSSSTYFVVHCSCSTYRRFYTSASSILIEVRTLKQKENRTPLIPNNQVYNIGIVDWLRAKYTWWRKRKNEPTELEATSSYWRRQEGTKFIRRKPEVVAEVYG